MVFPSLTQLELYQKITYAIISGIFIALFYFYGKMYHVATEKEETKEHYIITGLHFFLLFIIIPIVIFSTEIPNRAPSFYSDKVHWVNNLITLNRHITIFAQFMLLMALEQIAQKTTLVGFFCTKWGCIESVCKKLQQNCFFKYMIILFVIPFEYPSFVFGSKLTVSSHLSDFRVFFVSIIIVFLGLAYLAISLGNFQKYVEVAENMKLMKTLHDAWSDKDWHKFGKLHSKNAVVYWPDETEKISGRMENCRKAKIFFYNLSKNHIGSIDYKALFGQGNWTCSVATFKGTMMNNDLKTGHTIKKPFEVELCTIARWNNSEIIEERLSLTFRTYALEVQNQPQAA